jgi:internalin A
MRPGDRISPFIRQLTRADRVVAVISDKYLRSPYCMSEIHGLWQRSQEDADLIAECLVPIVLPEVKIEGLRERAVYVRYWKAEKKELETLFRELGPDLHDGSLRELRQVRAFAQDMDGILRYLQDVLMPRKLEAHLDDGFQAVRDALQRRIEADAEH